MVAAGRRRAPPVRTARLPGRGRRPWSEAGDGGLFWDLRLRAGFTGSAAARRSSTLVYWNLLSGGDGTHMEAMEAAYSKAHPGVTLESTILTWGNPYYTKLALAIRSGSPPDVAIMHLSRIQRVRAAGDAHPAQPRPARPARHAAQGLHPAGVSKAHFNGQPLAIRSIPTRSCSTTTPSSAEGRAAGQSGQLPPGQGAHPPCSPSCDGSRRTASSPWSATRWTTRRPRGGCSTPCTARRRPGPGG